jgi:hypothetical protein
MSRRKKITVIVIVITLILGGILLFLEFGEPTIDPSQPPAQDEPIFPFATTTDFFGGEDDNQISTTTTEEEGEDLPDLWKVTDDPVAGSQWVSQSDSSDDAIRFVKQETGHVFSANPDTRETTQLTDVTVPQVKQALISPDGQRIILRYLDDNNTIQTYNSRLKQSEGDTDVPYTLDGSFLAPNIYRISMSPGGNKLFYLQEQNNRSVGVVYNLQTDQRSQVFTSEVSRWRAQFTKNDSVTVFTPPADDTTGFAYRINTTNGNQEKIADATGLAVKENPDESAYLQTSQTDEGVFETTVEENSEELNISTISDKCVWESSNIVFCGVPDEQTTDSITAWYQGRVNYNDDLHLLNTESGNQDQLLSSDQIDQASADIIDIGINGSFTELIFTDRTSGDLWGFRL